MRRVLLLAASLALGLAVSAPPSTRAEDPEEFAQNATGYIEMPPSSDGTYTLAHGSGTNHNWGKPEFIRFLVAVSKEWARRHPDLPKLHFGDLSKQDGADFPPHKTHKDGLTADVFTKPTNVCHINYAKPEHTLELAELFAAYGARQILFNGDEVVKKVKVASKHENHDDHFHVVLDPKRMPEDGKPLVLPGSGLSDGSKLGGAVYDGKHLLLRWNLLGAAQVKSIEATFDDADDENGVLWTSGAQKPGREALLRAPVALDDGKTYRWKLELTLASGETIGFGWQKVTAELAPPTVEATGPEEDAQLSAGPELSWTFEKKGSEQATFTVELSDTGGKKVLVHLGPIASKEGTFAVRATPLRKNQRYHWRVRAADAAGNVGTSAWRSFKTTMDYRFVPPSGTANKAVQLTAPDGRATGKLKKGEAVLVLGESDERLIVRATRGQSEGLVERTAIHFDK